MQSKSLLFVLAEIAILFFLLAGMTFSSPPTYQEPQLLLLVGGLHIAVSAIYGWWSGNGEWRVLLLLDSVATIVAGLFALNMVKADLWPLQMVAMQVALHWWGVIAVAIHILVFTSVIFLEGSEYNLES